MHINFRWIQQWLVCLGCNEAYLCYCTAKKNNDLTLCAGLESTHPRIAEIYADFGDIYQKVATFSNSSVKAWLDSRRHLFINSAEVIIIEDPKTYIHRAGHIFLDIELSEDVAVTRAAVPDGHPNSPTHGHLKFPHSDGASMRC
jgi:hypothetical protein